ncbi:hypothetical protein [Frigoribacterium sp. UYMn621]|uniref:hypothetical protein n=1 Tax=Frigoribacterium sp. UYMn621 TaxID=3156343 RepID=UPI003391BD56
MATTTYTQVSVDAAVRAMLELPVGARKAARDAIAVTVLHQIARLSRGWCRVGGDLGLAQLEDVEAEAACFYLEALQEIATGRGPDPESIRNWDAYLGTRVAFQVSAWIRKTSTTGVPGSSSVARRATRASHVVQRFEAEHGREPTAQELVTASNAEMAARRSNPGKQGALLSIAEARSVLGQDTEARRA